MVARAKEKAEQHHPNPAARGRKNGTTAEIQVRNGLAFIMSNLCVDMPFPRANLVKKMIFSQRILPDPLSAIPIRSMIALERAASGKLNRPMERHRMLVCLRALRHRVAGIPLEHLSKYGVSSFRKFLPEVAQQRGLPADRWQQSRPNPPPPLLFLSFPPTPPHEQV